MATERFPLPPSLLTYCCLNELAASCHVYGQMTRFWWVPDACEHIAMMGALPGFVISASGPNKRTSLNVDIQYMAQKHIGWNSDAVNLIKIHLDIFLFYVHSECLNILDYCIVMYKCNIKVVMTNLCTGSPVTRRHLWSSRWCPLGNWL